MHLKVGGACAAVIVSLMALAVPAQATPLIDISAEWFVAPNRAFPQPLGVTLSCYGAAAADDGGCAGTAALQTNISASGPIAAHADGGMSITNTTDQALNGVLRLRSSFSAFNPGGPEVGLQIDDPLNQAALFASTVTGPGVADRHGCSIGFVGGSGAVFSPTTCGVPAPDASIGLFTVDLSTIAPHTSFALPYAIDIAAGFLLARTDSLPEPTAAFLMLTGFGVMVARRARRTSRPAARNP